jgi:hypothetical protein
MQDIFNEHNFPKTSRTVNHLCNFVTTHVVPRGGRAFHEPLRPPCLLNLHGTVHHWLRSAQSITDINLSMDQWWLSPDTSADEDVKAFVERCRQQLEMCNPVTKELLRSCELARAAHDRTVVLRFQYSDTGPDVSALYHTNSDRLPPHILLRSVFRSKDKQMAKREGTPEEHAPEARRSRLSCFPPLISICRFWISPWSHFVQQQANDSCTMAAVSRLQSTVTLCSTAPRLSRVYTSRVERNRK